MGLMAGPANAASSNNYIPADFSSEYSRALLPLLDGHSLERERLIRSLSCLLASGGALTGVEARRRELSRA